MSDPWKEDKLGYQEIGETFTNLIQSMNSSKVISIEAGFGRGKTFFRTAWAEHLRQSGEVVAELDVLKSDHSGDPVVTLLGALVEILPKEDPEKLQEVMSATKKLLAVGGRVALKAVLKSGADELIDAATDKAQDALDDFDALDNVIKDLGDGMSKAAGALISAQLAAENVRKKELPQQLEVLHSALVQQVESDRVIVIIDELDRCHPDFAISFLEAMSLVFRESPFVFCLMINADYLEALAKHRFGDAQNDEKYLDKFVDIRLGLGPKEDAFKNAVYSIASELPLAIPFGEDNEFSVERAAELAGELAVFSGLSMRKVKRILLKVEIALRCHVDRPLDAPLLVYMAFEDVLGERIPQGFLPRQFFTPAEAKEILKRGERYSRDLPRENQRRINEYNEIIRQNGPELVGLSIDRYKIPDDKPAYDWAKVLMFLAPHYIPTHRAVLDAVATVLVPEKEEMKEMA